MKRVINKRDLIIIVLLADIAIGFVFIKSRLFSHLAVWNIVESGRPEDFNWPPERAPEYFRFERNNPELLSFREEVAPVVKGARNELEVAVGVTKYLSGLGAHKRQWYSPLKWDSPRGILEQMKKGIGGHCFHKSILVSTYLSSLGIKSRLWALENKKFDGVSHSVVEVYVKTIKKWVFIDPMMGFFVVRKEDGAPLSFLDLRSSFLRGKTAGLSIKNILGPVEENRFRPFYKRLVTCAFLRARNDFIDQYPERYGALALLKKYLDRLPNSIRIGLGYFLSDSDIFIHYKDEYSPSLKGDVIVARELFYVFILLSGGLGIFLLLEWWGFLRSRSKKDTRHE